LENQETGVLQESNLLKDQDWPQKSNPAPKSNRKVWIAMVLLVCGVLYSGTWKDTVQTAKQILPEKPVRQLLEKSSLAPTVDRFSQKIREMKNQVLENTPFVQQAAYTGSGNGEHRPIHSLRFEVRHSLTYSLCGLLPQDECTPLSAHVARILAWFMDVSRSVRNGDQVSLVYEEVEGDEAFRILKLEYDSQYLKQTLNANFFRAPSMLYGSYFDNQGREIFPRLQERTAPIRRYEAITSLPGDFRRGEVHGHNGTDFKAEVGTPVYASFDGRVRRTNWNRRRNGFCIEIVHPREGVKTLYLHLDQVKVWKGQYVKRGQQIGTSGNTGRSFAPHLHYELRSLGKQERIHNPFTFKYHKKYIRKISVEARDEFQELVRLYSSVLKEDDAHAERLLDNDAKS